MSTPVRPPDLVVQFLAAAEPRLAYRPALKVVFHQRGVALFRRMAWDLGYRPGEYDLRSNQGGIAVSGEITLHTDDLYLQAAQWSGNHTNGLLYRECASRQDYVGGRNRWMPFEALRAYDTALAQLTAARRQPP